MSAQVERVGKYRIIALLGQGGMASVYLSVVPGPAGVNKLLVVKLLRDELSADEDFVAMFLNEARLAARLNHANVVQTYEVGMEGHRHFLAMDYLDGQPLHALLRKAGRGGTPLDVHVRILADMLTGLHYAHTLKDFDGTDLSVVHRDVSPQNVFVTYDGQVKVVDFGIAKAAGAASNTQSGVFKGKLSYVAPEQAGGEHVDHRADIFSVGVMLWEAIAQKRFAQGSSQTVMLGRRLAGTEPRIRDAVPDVDPELADICDRAMAHRAADRFATAEDFRAALEGFLDRYSRRVGTREVGQFLSGLFAQERASIRAVIDEQMKRLQRETSTALPIATIDVYPTGREPTPITTIERREAAEKAARAMREGMVGPESTGGLSPSQGTLVAAHLSQAPPVAASGGKGMLVGVGLLAFLLVAGVGAAIATRSRPDATPVAPAASASAAPAPADSAQVKVSITFGPQAAIAKLDGVPLSESPFVAHAKRDGSMHRIDVEGPGLKPETRMVSYEKDVVVTVVLGPADAPAPTTSAVAPVADGAAAAAGAGGKKTGGGKGKGGDARPGKSLGIDEKDPYKQ
jgi:serine/threonine-protein kinase